MGKNVGLRNIWAIFLFSMIVFKNKALHLGTVAVGSEDSKVHSWRIPPQLPILHITLYEYYSPLTPVTPLEFTAGECYYNNMEQFVSHIVLN